MLFPAIPQGYPVHTHTHTHYNQHTFIINHAAYTSIVHPGLLSTLYWALELAHSDDIHAPLLRLCLLVGFANGKHQQEFRRKEQERLRCPPGTSLWSHHGLAVSLHLRHLSHAFSISRFVTAPPSLPSGLVMLAAPCCFSHGYCTVS